jgi:hypothetical protein
MKAADPKRTDGVARAMADVEVDLAKAEVDWEIAKYMWVNYGWAGGEYDAD